MKTLDFVLVAPLGLVSLTSACESKPCSGGGMQVDTRPLPDVWNETAPPVPGAIACNSDDGVTNNEWSRSYEFGADPQEGKTLWTAHLTGNGWKDTGETHDDDTYRQATFEREGHKIDFKCSRMVQDKGWCTLTFTAHAP